MRNPSGDRQPQPLPLGTPIAQIAAATAVAVSIVGVALGLLWPSGRQDGRGFLVRAIGVNYSVRLALGDDNKLRVNEQVTVGGATAREAGIGDVPVPRGQQRRLLLAFREWLTRHGWRTSASCRGDFCRIRSPQHVRVHHIVPAERTNRFRPPSFPDQLLGLPMRVTIDDTSRLTLDAPTNAIGGTFPSAARGRGPDGTERVAVPVPADGESVEFDVRNDLFRNPVLVSAVDVTVWTPFPPLLAAMATMISARAREFLRRKARQLRGWLLPGSGAAGS